MAIGSGVLKKPKSQLKISCHSSILFYQRPTIKIAVTSITIVNAHSVSFLGKFILLRGIQNFVFCSLEEGAFFEGFYQFEVHASIFVYSLIYCCAPIMGPHHSLPSLAQ